MHQEPGGRRAQQLFAVTGITDKSLRACVARLLGSSYTPNHVLTLVEHGKAPQLGIRTTPLTRSAARLAALADLYAQGKLTVHILASFPLARAADAHRAYRAGNVRGKIVLTIDAGEGIGGHGAQRHTVRAS